MRVTLTDNNESGIKGVIESLELCRNKNCNLDTLHHCLTAEPVPHLSALENLWLKFRVEGMSVKTRIQLLRHRLFSNMERSTRHIKMSEAEFVIPFTAKDSEFFNRQYELSKIAYDKAIEKGESYEDAAYLLPMGVETNFDIAGNGRTWWEFLQKRLCLQAQDEIRSFAEKIFHEIRWFLKINGLKEEQITSIFAENVDPCERCFKFTLGECEGNNVLLFS